MIDLGPFDSRTKKKKHLLSDKLHHVVDTRPSWHFRSPESSVSVPGSTTPLSSYPDIVVASSGQRQAETPISGFRGAPLSTQSVFHERCSLDRRGKSHSRGRHHRPAPHIGPARNQQPLPQPKQICQTDRWPVRWYLLRARRCAHLLFARIQSSRCIIESTPTPTPVWS